MEQDEVGLWACPFYSLPLVFSAQHSYRLALNTDQIDPALKKKKKARALNCTFKCSCILKICFCDMITYNFKT